MKAKKLINIAEIINPKTLLRIDVDDTDGVSNDVGTDGASVSSNIPTDKAYTISNQDSYDDLAIDGRAPFFSTMPLIPVSTQGIEDAGMARKNSTIDIAQKAKKFKEAVERHFRPKKKKAASKDGLIPIRKVVKKLNERSEELDAQIIFIPKEIIDKIALKYDAFLRMKQSQKDLSKATGQEYEPKKIKHTFAKNLLFIKDNMGNEIKNDRPQISYVDACHTIARMNKLKGEDMDSYEMHGGDAMRMFLEDAIKKVADRWEGQFSSISHAAKSTPKHVSLDDAKRANMIAVKNIKNIWGRP